MTSSLSFNSFMTICLRINYLITAESYHKLDFEKFYRLDITNAEEFVY